MKRTAIKENLLIKAGQQYEIEILDNEPINKYRVHIPDNKFIPYWDLSKSMIVWYFGI